MDLVHVDAGRRRDDGARRERLGVGVGGITPELVEPREKNRLFVNAGEEVWLAILSGAMVPLVKTVDGNNARTSREGVAKGGLLRDPFGARVKESIANLGIFRPARH